MKNYLNYEILKQVQDDKKPSFAVVGQSQEMEERGENILAIKQKKPLTNGIISLVH